MSFPTIKLDIQGLREQVVHALLQRQEEVSKYVDSQLRTLIENFDFEKIIAAELPEVLRGIIKSSVSSAVYKIFSEEDVQNALCELFKNTILKHFDIQVKNIAKGKTK